MEQAEVMKINARLRATDLSLQRSGLRPRSDERRGVSRGRPREARLLLRALQVVLCMLGVLPHALQLPAQVLALVTSPCALPLQPGGKITQGAHLLQQCVTLTLKRVPLALDCVQLPLDCVLLGSACGCAGDRGLLCLLRPVLCSGQLFSQVARYRALGVQVCLQLLHAREGARQLRLYDIVVLLKPKLVLLSTQEKNKT